MAVSVPHAAPPDRNFRQTLSWYRNRVAAMSLPEIGYRIGEQLKRRISRALPSAPAADAATVGDLPGLAGGLVALAGDSGLRADWREATARLRSGRVRRLGLEWPARGGATDWHLDPVSGGRWPADSFCFDVPYRRQTQLGDVKYVWELNRLQHLQPVAALAALEEDRSVAEACCAEIDGWIAANPPYRGVNWASGIELALRVVSLLVVKSLLEPKGLLSLDRGKLAATLAAHGYWLRRFPSRYSSANNHCVAEAGALFLLGALAPGLSGAGEWAASGRAILLAEAERQILEDGVGAEQSPTYTAFTLEWLLLCGVVAARLGNAFPARYWQRLASAGVHLRWITDAAGGQPRIGDDDEGRVFCSRTDERSYVSAVLGCLAATLGRADLAPPAPAMDLRTAFFGDAPSGAPAPTGVRRFAAGGYTIARTEHGGHEGLVVFDHGPLGFLSIAAHGHADALALWLHLDGRPVLVDAGTYLYHAGGCWRDHFRGTPAHNTLSIAGTDSSRIGGPFNWTAKAAAQVISFDGSAERWHVEAEHDGFVRDFGVRHRRRLERVAPDRLVVTDVLRGRGGPFEVEIGFLLHPAVSIAVDGGRAVVGDGKTALLAIDAETPLTPFVQRGETEPARGWYSPAFGEKVPARRLAYVGRMAVDAASRFTLRLFPDVGCAR
jgi:uncharacterized heparinase superfamily protein